MHATEYVVFKVAQESMYTLGKLWIYPEIYFENLREIIYEQNTVSSAGVLLPVCFMHFVFIVSMLLLSDLVVIPYTG